ncbi:MAG: hypothetical protein JXR96_20540 [Deltaproteobacteria bacterium]|nr:hypothetical protein [Deltaproteobacteria bacterium]
MRRSRCMPRVARLLLLCALGHAPLAAGDEKPEPAEAEPPRPPGWLMPCGRVQLDMDPELVPMHKGAVFVPAMSESPAEPPYIVRSLDGKLEARSPMGKKVVLPPGRYTLLAGSGVESQMMERDVDVHEGHTTLVEPDWSGLIVRVVDERGAQFRGAYEIFALPSGEDFGIGLGADETRGETLRTWLLPPGRYMVVRQGETTRARTDFLTVRLQPGELVTFTLVQKEEDGSILGGGIVDRWEGKTEIENWRIGLRVGGDALWNRNDHVVGREFGNTLTFNVFVDANLRYLDPDHLAYCRLQIDEGAALLPGRDIGALQKNIDELDFDAIYTYRLLPWLGPYVRFALNTNLFPGKRLFDTRESDVIILNPDKSVFDRLVRPDRVDLANPFDPVEIKEGIGVSFDWSPTLVLDLHLRLGFGARQTVVQQLLVDYDPGEDEEDLCQDAVCLMRAESNDLLGAEGTLIGSARLARWLMIDTELETLIPFYSSASGTDPVVNWKNTISLRLVWFASLAYVVKLDYNKQLNKDYPLQFEQRILLRFTFDIL